MELMSETALIVALSTHFGLNLLWCAAASSSVALSVPPMFVLPILACV